MVKEYYYRYRSGVIDKWSINGMNKESCMPTGWKVDDRCEYGGVQDGEGKAQYSRRKSECPCGEHLHAALFEKYW